ncbi:alpha/beta fold hydrolase [Lactobacillus sp. LL6]|uniref:alpha/beta fold hydrolase n=1 Tax=Lactobacillus sp. LL6 TaxID=2596827 RepID=UPI001186D66B|nr:alpha/beta fold hydrolase [Lactobacillus sp. LL6]TSO25447.1 acetylxylan esterase [Lactobacillus sp. LL6]
MKDTMTVKEMCNYLGRMEAPDDFDKFWDKQLANIENVPYKIVTHKFGLKELEFFDLYFKGSNNGTVYAKCIFPKCKKPVPVVFYFHGYMGQSPDWATLLQFAPTGVAVVAMDVRGQQGKSIDNSTFNGNTVKGHIIRGAVQGKEHLFYKDIYLDVYTLIEIVSDFDDNLVDTSHLYSYGGSQGGALALIAAALNPKISKVVSQYPFLSDFKRVLELGNQSDAYDELFRYFKFYDPYHDTENELLNTLSYIDVKNFAHRIKCPVLMVTGLEDNVCFPSTQYAIFNRIKSKKVHKIMPEYGHEDMHVEFDNLAFNWLFGTSFPTHP